MGRLTARLISVTPIGAPAAVASAAAQNTAASDRVSNRFARSALTALERCLTSFFFIVFSYFLVCDARPCGAVASETPGIAKVSAMKRSSRARFLNLKVALAGAPLQLGSQLDHWSAELCKALRYEGSPIPTDDRGVDG